MPQAIRPDKRSRADSRHFLASWTRAGSETCSMLDERSCRGATVTTPHGPVLLFTSNTLLNEVISKFVLVECPLLAVFFNFPHNYEPRKSGSCLVFLRVS